MSSSDRFKLFVGMSLGNLVVLGLSVLQARHFEIQVHLLEVKSILKIYLQCVYNALIHLFSVIQDLRRSPDEMWTILALASRRSL